MSGIAIRVEGLGKAYRIGLKEQQHETMLGALAAWVKSPFENFRSVRNLSRFDEVKADLETTDHETGNRKSEARTPRSAIRNPQSPIRNPLPRTSSGPYATSRSRSNTARPLASSAGTGRGRAHC